MKINRKGLEIELKKYVENFYADGVSAVYAEKDSNYPIEVPALVVVEPEVVPVVEEPVVEAAAVKEEEKSVEEVEKTEEDSKVEVEGDTTPAPIVVDEAEIVEPVVEVAEPEVKEVEVPGLKSRVFSLYFVGNKYNPTNYWFVITSSHTILVD